MKRHHIRITAIQRRGRRQQAMVWPCRGRINMPGMITSRHGKMRLTEPRPFSKDGVSASESRPREGTHAPSAMQSNVVSSAQQCPLHNKGARCESVACAAPSWCRQISPMLADVHRGGSRLRGHPGESYGVSMGWALWCWGHPLLAGEQLAAGALTAQFLRTSRTDARLHVTGKRSASLLRARRGGDRPPTSSTRPRHALS